MIKVLFSAALGTVVLLTATRDAPARCRRYRFWAPVYRYQYPYQYPVAVPAAPAIAGAAPGAAYSYRSFSYDPGEAPVYPPPPSAGRRLYPYEPPFFKADHKLLGTSYRN